MNGIVTETHQTLHHTFIGMKSEVEVRQRFLEFQKAEQFFILQRFTDLRFNGVRLFVNLLQEIQERRRRSR